MKRIFSSIPEEKERKQPSWKIRCRPMWHTEESAILIADGKVRKQRFEEKISETVTKVLFEESVTIDGKVYASGHTMEYIRMLMETTENLDNQILLVKAGKERCQDCLLCTKARS